MGPLSAEFPANSRDACSCNGGFPSTEESTQLRGLIFEIGHVWNSEDTQVHSLLTSDLGAELPLHISLSRPIVLLADQRHSFVDDLTSRIAQAGICPYVVVTVLPRDMVTTDTHQVRSLNGQYGLGRQL